MSRSPRVAILSLTASVLLAAGADSTAQVFDPGPSDPSLFTNGVFNVPPDPAPLFSVGDLQQLNLGDGGEIQAGFRANSGSEVNIRDGTVGFNFNANSGSEVNISGGTIGPSFRADSGSEINISGGTLEGLTVGSGSLVNISGGTINGLSIRPTGELNISGGAINDLPIFSNGDVTISGGTFAPGFNNFFTNTSANVELIGGEFHLNGAPFTGTTVTIGGGEVFSGVFADGSPFVFGAGSSDRLLDVTVSTTPTPLAPADPTPIVINTPVADGPVGLRSGQTLTLEDGGQLGDHFAVVGGTLRIEGGGVGDGLEITGADVFISGGVLGESADGADLLVYNGGELNFSGGTARNTISVSVGGVANIRGGTLDSDLRGGGGSEVNISGGTVGEADFFPGSVANLFGDDFTIDGVPIDGLSPGETLVIDDRDVTLAGVFSDGTPFRFDLNSTTNPSGEDFFGPGSTLTVTLVPEPSVGVLAMLAAAGVASARGLRPSLA